MSVVVGYLPSPLGDAALAAAIEEATRRRTNLVVVNTTRGDRLVDPRWVPEPRVDELRERLERSGLETEIRHFTSGESAAEDLLGVAEELDAELVVIGLRHRSAVGKLLLGSTAQSVLLGARCPVLAVKT